MLHILPTDIVGLLRAGSSRPIVVADASGARFVVKPKASGGGLRETVCEAIVTMLAARMALPALACRLIEITESIVRQAPGDELPEALQRSLGTNLGFDYCAGAAPFSAENPGDMSPETRDALFLFDLLLLNVDRTIRNPNLLVHEGKTIAYDFGSCLRLLSREPVDAIPHAGLTRLRAHPFYRDCSDMDPYSECMKRTPLRAIDALREEFPEEWQPIAGELLARLNAIMSAPDWLPAALAAVNAVTPETQDERAAQVKRNLQAFTEKTGFRLR